MHVSLCECYSIQVCRTCVRLSIVFVVVMVTMATVVHHVLWTHSPTSPYYFCHMVPHCHTVLCWAYGTHEGTQVCDLPSYTIGAWLLQWWSCILWHHLSLTSMPSAPSHVLTGGDSIFCPLSFGVLHLLICLLKVCAFHLYGKVQTCVRQCGVVLSSLHECLNRKPVDGCMLYLW